MEEVLLTLGVICLGIGRRRAGEDSALVRLLGRRDVVAVALLAVAQAGKGEGLVLPGRVDLGIARVQHVQVDKALLEGRHIDSLLLRLGNLQDSLLLARHRTAGDLEFGHLLRITDWVARRSATVSALGRIPGQGTSISSSTTKVVVTTGLDSGGGRSQARDGGSKRLVTSLLSGDSAKIDNGSCSRLSSSIGSELVLIHLVAVGRSSGRLACLAASSFLAGYTCLDIDSLCEGIKGLVTMRLGLVLVHLVGGFKGSGILGKLSGLGALTILRRTGLSTLVNLLHTIVPCGNGDILALVDN